MTHHIYKYSGEDTTTMKYWLVYAFALLLLLPAMTSAQDVIGTFKQGTAIELTQVCTNDTSLCDECNVSTVKYPNGTVAARDLTMTKRTNDFNVTLPAQNTSALGTYNVLGHCKSGTQFQSWSYSFDVTTTGDGNAMIFIILFLLISFGLFMMGMYLHNEYLIFISGTGLIVTGMYIMIYGLGNLQNLYTRMIAFITLGLGLFFAIAASIHAINASKDGWSMGDSDDE